MRRWEDRKEEEGEEKAGEMPRQTKAGSRRPFPFQAIVITSSSCSPMVTTSPTDLPSRSLATGET